MIDTVKQTHMANYPTYTNKYGIGLRMWFNKNGNHTEVVEITRPPVVMKQGTGQPQQAQEFLQYTQDTTHPTLIFFGDQTQHSTPLTGDSTCVHVAMLRLSVLGILANVF